MANPNFAVTVLHSSELEGGPEDGFYVYAYVDGDRRNVTVFPCTFKRRRDARIALYALVRIDNIDRINAAYEKGEEAGLLETRKVMTECLQW